MRHFLTVSRQRTCQLRTYTLGVRENEWRMRCPFCGEQGNHYADACPHIGTGNARANILNESNKCSTCFEVNCPQGRQCPRFNILCTYCLRNGHHSEFANIQTDQDKYWRNNKNA
ncbi:unnamed protein product [Nippostrongylus brasiliensis]|uniref:CCHC-type domain-containing protein n=1 Tax=Nippostrongylus brasiliensis TaxID=27835 RepID=A0A0N4YMM5_NIPBR|nr:hypothetical protein Q1695_011585 [Nippostrongylus brasiliensis]VDL82160.1 unnamed protein product [Nippostrongylus brasiliensis]